MTDRISRLIVCTCLTALSVIGTVFCLVTAFDFHVSVIAVTLTSFLSALIMTFGFQKKRFFLCFLLVIFLFFLPVLITGADTVRISAQQVVHEILSRYSSAYKNVSFSIPPAASNFRESYYTVFFCMIAVLLSVWMAWGIGYRSCLISVAGTLPFLLLCVIINDTPPSVLPLILLISVWITVLLTNGHETDAGLLDATRLTLLFFAVILVFGCVGIVYPKDDTTNDLPELIDSIIELLPEELQDLMSRESKGTSTQELGADTADTLDLTTQGIRSRTDDIMMQLSGTEIGPLYLRAAAKDIYTGTAWKSEDNATDDGALYSHTSLGEQFGTDSQAAVQIKNYRDDNSVAFVPYGFISCSGISDTSSDLRITINESDYIIYYWPGIQSLDLTQHYNNSNEAYENYVNTTCLTLPSSTAKTLYDIAVSYGYSPEMTKAETITWVADFIRSVGTYNLNVSCQPKNIDFAVYFLTESRQGYCVHFATAACAMYRALGIPSRYASGYKITVTEAGAVVDVTDRNTHAWAEVYIQGLGWIPVETTPGFGETSQLPTLSEEVTFDDTITEPATEITEAQPEVPPAAEEQSSDSTTEEASTNEPQQNNGENDTTETTVQETETIPQSELPSKDLTRISILALIGILLLSFFANLVRLRVIQNTRRKRIATEDLNEAVIAIWSYLELLMPYGATVPDAIYEIALKAKFSEHHISREEYDAMLKTMKQQYVHLQQTMKPLSKIRFTLIAGLRFSNINRI